MKKILAVSLSLALTTPAIAAASLIPQFLLKNHASKNLVKKSALFNDDYVDFSGHWIGSCDNDPDNEVELNIELSSDFSSISIDNVSSPIDAITTEGAHGTEQQESSIRHLRWSPNGQELLGTFMSYFKEGNLAQGDFTSIVGNTHLFMNNEQLIVNYELTFFMDGVLENTQKIHCTYKNQDKK